MTTVIILLFLSFVVNLATKYPKIHDKNKTNTVIKKYKIIEQINEISALKEIKRIYIVFATQSPLPFEIGKQLNDRMAKEVIICHYQNDSCVPYEWGIALNGKNKEKYIDLKEV